MVDAIVIGLRALGLVLVLQAAGTSLFLCLFRDALGQSVSKIAALGRYSALAGLLLTIAYQLGEPARMAGAFTGVLDSSLQTLSLTSNSGVAASVRVLALVLVAFGSDGSNRLRQAAAIVGATLVVASFAFVGHTAVHDQRWLLASLLIVHLLVLAFWFGSLAPLWLAAQRDGAATSGLLIERFSALAIRVVPVVFFAGLGLSVGLLPDLASLWTPYGLLLMTKICGFAVLMGLAALNKWRLGPAVLEGQGGALGAFRRSVSAEWLLISAILTVTAVMTASFSPTH